jgi:sugar lactone lactonase YvrE
MKTFKLVLNSSIILAGTMLLASGLAAQTVTTTAGGFVGDGGPATKASFELPGFVVQDKSGNLYISDFSGQRIRKVTPAGTISTYAGTGISGFSGDGGPASSAQLSFPTGLVFDSAGDLIVADGLNNRIRKIDPSGIITTIAGTGAAGYTGDGGPALDATFNQVWDVTYDPSGNLYITDIGNCAVRIVNPSGIINTYAGNGTCGYGGDGRAANHANLNFPRGMVFAGGNLYIADTLNHRVRKVNTHGIISTFAGNGQPGFSGDGGKATAATIGNPKGLAFRNGTVYIANAGRAHIRTVTIKTGIINTYAGTFPGYDGDGNALLSSSFFNPNGLLFNSAGNLLVVDTLNQRVREAAGGVMTTIAGGFIGDKRAATSASLAQPEATAFDKSGNYYIADATGNSIRKVSTNGKITTVAGTGISGYSGDGGQATAATLWYPLGVGLDSSNNLFISDDFNNVIRKVDAAGKISSFFTDANASGLGAMAVDGSDNLYVVDQTTCVVWFITPAGVGSVVAGIPFQCGFAGDGGPATTAQLNLPLGVALDKQGNIYVADAGNNRIRAFKNGGNINTVAGDGTCGFSGDGGLATLAELCFPADVAINRTGLYIADELNVRIRKVNGAGHISTYAGTGSVGYNGEGLPALSTNLDDPVALSFSPAGTLYLVDDLTMRVRKVH